MFSSAWARDDQTHSVETVRRRRGRPRKNKNHADFTPTKTLELSSTIPPPSPRPLKNDNIQVNGAQGDEDEVIRTWQIGRSIGLLTSNDEAVLTVS